ncbi:hypothetical protein M422DRAFT_26765 [Sphaerobolus stellatus SS14]|nr:hypothetical protein M422DRAFT_26765 [Sphaerobolus stellatus SS14]
MEDLVQHCMRELAFDGELGCDVSRLQQFIEGFYKSKQPSFKQNVDTSFCGFVWSLLAEQPSVIVGLTPQDGASEVYIAPQPSKVKSAGKKKKEDPEEEYLGRLNPIPDAANRDLESLLQEYGTSLRVGVDPDTCFRAITGSHTRPAKLTPMVYTALQLISRGRENGLSVIELGKKTGYDQKTCFYLVKQLLTLDLVVKFAAGGPGGGNFCIHKYFYSGSSFWQSVREEEGMADDEVQEKGTTPERAESQQPGGILKFDPIDSRHLASAQLIKSRITTLLKNSENGLHHYHNLLVTIGFAKPTKQDRRFFIIRIRELIKEGVIEKVLVPRAQSTSTKPAKSTLCIRLVEDPRSKDDAGVVVQPGDTGDDEQEGEAAEGKEVEVDTAPVMDMTIHRQILKRLEEAGEYGLTLNELSSKLGMFDRRTIELILYRLERYPPPPHFAELTVCDSMENVGRQRHHRYYTLPGYLEFLRREKIDDAGRNEQYTSVDTSKSGDFADQSEMRFFKTEAELAKYEDEYRDMKDPEKGKQRRKLGRPRKEDSKPRKKPAKVTKKAAAQAKKDAGQDEDVPDIAPAAKGAKKGRKRKEPDEGNDDAAQEPPQKKARATRGKGKKGKETPANTVIANPNDAEATEATSGAMDIVTDDPPRVIESKNAAVVETNPSNSMMDVEVTQSVPSVATPTTNGVEGDVTLNDVPPDVPEERGASVIASAKRKASTPLDPEDQPAKKWKSGRPKRTRELVNISQLRAENEIMRMVEEFDGVVNISPKEFYEAYTKVLTSIAAAGEPTSMPVGTQPDRRTLQKIIDKLVERGKLKTLTVTITPRAIQPRVARLIYDPAVPQEKLDAYLVSLREEAPTPAVPVHKQLEAGTTFTRSKAPRAKELNHREHPQDPKEQDEWRRQIAESGDDDTLMRAKFLSEGQIVAQLYGYLLGRVTRARELHQFTLLQLGHPEDIPHIVSKTQRIIAFPYFFQDLPLSTYLALISNVEYNEELSVLMSTPEGRQIPVKGLPPHLYDQLQIGRARARSRIIDLLEILVSLKLITPLQATDSETASFTCEPHGSHPTRFNLASAPKSEERGTTTAMSLFWKFNEIAPIYFFGEPTDGIPSFHRDILVRTADESMEFWTELEEACIKQSQLPMGSSDSMTGPYTCTPQVARTLRRRQAWTSSYVLSWSQKQYLHQQWTDPSRGYTPLSDPDGGVAALERICSVTFIPFEVIRTYFLTSHQIFHRTAEKMRAQQAPRVKDEEEAARDKALLARKAAEARAQMEADWDALVTRVHPETLPYGSVSKVKALRTRYIQSRGSLTVSQWEAAVTEAISSSRYGRRNPTLPTGRRKRNLPTAPALIPQVPTGKERSVEEIVEQLRKKGPTTPSAGESRRRQRFQWTAEYDELIRDISAIVRARCRTWHRVDWGAFDQLFPTLTRNVVRQRLNTLKQEGGAESYLRALEDKWYELWQEHRGTPALPDEHAEHPSDFDAITHVEFLRKYIDKQALRVGLSRVADHPSVGAQLTENPALFTSAWTFEEVGQPTEQGEIIWNTAGDEHREKALLGLALTVSPGHEDSRPGPGNDRSESVAEAALKMVFGTQDEEYNAEDASTLLENVGQDRIRRASDELSAKGVISELNSSHRKRPGRQMKISEQNEDALGGIIPIDTFADACMTEDSVEEGGNDWKEWNLLASNGDMAAFIDLVSEGRLDLKIDLSEPASYRDELDWNSKKVDDDQIEGEISFRYRNFPQVRQSSPSASNKDAEGSAMEVDKQPLEETDNEGHEEQALCRKFSDAIVTCPACVGSDRSCILKNLEPEKRVLFVEVTEQLDQAGSEGLSYDSAMISKTPVNSFLASINSKFQSTSYWLDYDRPVLVSSLHVEPWLVLIPGPKKRYVFPRRWLNIKGERMESIWNAGLRAVIGLLLTRPGINQANLRSKLENLYDRQETIDLLNYLHLEEVAVKSTYIEDKHLLEKDIRSLGGSEEQRVHWSLSPDAWYRVAQPSSIT